MLRKKRERAAPGAREGGHHLVHQPRQVVRGHAWHRVLAADHRDAPAAQRGQQRLAHQAARWAEGPALQACVQQKTPQEGTLSSQSASTGAGRAGGPAIQACVMQSICLKKALSHLKGQTSSTQQGQAALAASSDCKEGASTGQALQS